VLVTRKDARAYLRSLAAQHLSFVFFAVGGLLACAGLSGVGAPMILVGVVMWTVALAAGTFRSARRNRGKPFFGGDGVQAEANWWLGWGPMDDAAVATNRDVRQIRRAATVSLVVGAVSVVLWFPVAAFAL
jgi:hypothetical protein